MQLTVSDPITALGPLATRYARALHTAGISTIRDLLFYYPYRYEDWSHITPIRVLTPDSEATVRGRVSSIAAIQVPWRRQPNVEAVITDKDGDAIMAVWFNSPFLLKSITPGSLLLLTGKVDSIKGSLRLIHPQWERSAPGQTRDGVRLMPVYHLSGSLTQKILRTLAVAACKRLPRIPDHLPSWMLASAKCISLDQALRGIHHPRDWGELRRAEQRLKFDELFFLQLRSARARHEISQLTSVSLPFDQKAVKSFVDRLPFALTQAQRKTAWEIIQDMEKPQPMNRLLEGDVGSGKTVIAAIAALHTLHAGFQTAYLAPTSILAVQHFTTFCTLFKETKTRIALFTQSDCRIRNNGSETTDQETKGLKKKLLELLKNIKIDIVIGTHALLSPAVRIPRLALVIVDEQHRFGVKQRHTLLRGSMQMETRINADDDNFLYKELTYIIRGAAFEVANSLGLGLKENVYQKALEVSLKQKKLSYEREKSINVTFHDTRVGSFKPDFIIDDKVIVELKALPFIGKIEEKQLWSYLKGSNYKIAYLINFGGEKLDIRRIIYDTARDNPRESALYLRPSAISPHLLTMTATPIPRSLALVAYGDLDLSILDEMPKGRAAITTRIIAPEARPEAYDLIRDELEKGRQCFIICPLIDPSDTLGVKSVKQEAARLAREHFPHARLAMLHGRMSARAKDETMKEFFDGGVQVLVATPVVEVGIDAPNATVMLIEGAERFGLAQLHQLRGRVGRSTYPSHCLLATDTESESTLSRLHAVVASQNGFALAEKDLEIRGPGEAYGTKQAGFLDTLKIAKLTDAILLKQSQEAVSRLLAEDPLLMRHPALATCLSAIEQSAHLE